MTRLHHVAPTVAESIVDHRKIRSFLNVIVHGYDVIDDETTWDVIEHKLPTLLADLERLLKPPDA